MSVFETWFKDRADARAKQWSDYLGYHARAFFFFVLSFVTFEQLGQNRTDLTVDPLARILLWPAAILALIYALIMCMHIVAVTAHYFGGLATTNARVAFLYTAPAVLYGAAAGVLLWAIARLAALRLFGALLSGSPQ